MLQSEQQQKQRVLGVMTGTSLDGVDLCLCKFINNTSILSPSSPKLTDVMQIEKFATLPYPPQTLQLVKQLLQSGGDTTNAITSPSFLLHLICAANTSWSREIGSLINEFLRDVTNNNVDDDDKDNNNNVTSDIVIASHGQTIWHISGDSTLQIGDTEILAHVTKKIVIGNFRAADVANGGTGAPLVPFLDRFLAADAMKRYLSDCSRTDPSSSSSSSSGLVLLQNLGGIGNTSIVYVNEQQQQEILVAFDTGPANVILNELVMSLTNENDGLCAKVLKKILSKTSSSNEDEEISSSSLSWAMTLQRLFKSSSPVPIDFDQDGFYSSRGKSIVERALEWSVTSEYFEVFEDLRKRKYEMIERSNSNGDGKIDHVSQLRSLLRDAFSRRTTGREDFGPIFTSLVYLRDCFDFLHNNKDEKEQEEFQSAESFIQHFCDLCMTASLFTAKSIAMHLEIVQKCWKSFSEKSEDGEKSNNNNNNNIIMLCSGGGSCNPVLMHHIATETSFFVGKVAKLSEFVQFQTVSGSNFDQLDDAKEAIAFALMGREKLLSLSKMRKNNNNDDDKEERGTNEPCATGARRKCFLGQISIPN